MKPPNGRYYLIPGLIFLLLGEVSWGQNIYYLHINQPDELKIEATIDSYNLLLNDSLVLGNEIQVHGGTGAYQYQWFSPNLHDTVDKPIVKVSPIKTSEYTFMVNDEAGCSKKATIDVNVIEPLKVNSTVHDSICYGSNNGRIELKISKGAPPYSFIWNNGDTVSTLSNLTAGVYSVTITDQMNQSAIKDFYIEEKPKIESIVDETICSTDVYLQGNKQYNKSGNYTDTLVSKEGCDSVVVLNLTVNPSPEKPLIEVTGNRLKSSSTNVQWYKSGLIIEGATLPELTVNQSGSYFVEAFNENNCSTYSDTLFFSLLNNKIELGILSIQ